MKKFQNSFLRFDMPSNKNKVELLGIYGSDESHALSAWTSTSRELNEEKRNRIPQLLKMLADNEHHSVFEKSSLHFLVTSDLASHVHLLKHRIGVSINAESARYKELKDDKYYTPTDWDEEEVASYTEHMEISLQKYHETLNRLVEKGMSRKRAKESARLYLPYGNQITADVMFNFRSFYHFLHLRYSEHAQLEIRDIARQMLELVVNSNAFPATLEAFGLVVNNEIRKPFK
jgi:flavin-dependent thymidylate synthase